MSKNKNSTSEKHRVNKTVLGVAVCTVVLIYWRWLLPGAITFGDWFYFTKSNICNFVPYLWNTRSALGSYVISAVPLYPIIMLQGFLCRILNLDFAILERLLVFGPLVSLFIFSPWYLARTLGFGRIATATTILVFNLNVVMFLNTTVPLLCLSDAMAPLVFALFIRTVRHPDIKRGLLYGLSVSLQILIEIRGSYITLFLCSLYLLYSIVINAKNRQDFRRICKYLLFSAIVVILLHSYWTIPLLFGKTSDMTPTILPESYKTASGLTSLSYMTLLHSVGINTPFWGRPGIFNPINPQFLFLPIIVFSFLLFGRQKRKIIFFAMSALIFSFLVKGYNPPFPGINVWLFLHFPGFFMFRTPGKWFIPLILSYAVLAGYLINQVITREFINNTFINLKRRFNAHPFIIKTGIFISVIAVIFIVFPVQPISTLRYSGIWKPLPVPKESFYFEDFINSQKKFFRVIWLPSVYRFGHFSTQHPSIHGYQLGQEMLSSVSTRNYFSYLGQPFSPWILRSLSVKYVIVPSVPADYSDEMYYWWGLPPEYYHRLLDKTPGINLVDFKGKSKVYKLTNPLAHLYISSSSNIITGN